MNKKTLDSLETWSPDDNSFCKFILKSGTGESRPNEGSVCTVELHLIDQENVPDEKLGGYQPNKEWEVTIGEGDTLLSQLFDKIVMNMKAGEQSYVKCNVDIEGKQVEKYQPETDKLKCRLFLKSFDRVADPSELLADEKLERAEHHKNQGTAIYQNNLKFSLDRFCKSLSYLKEIDSKCVSTAQAKQLKTLKLQCYLNLAAGCLKEEKYDDVIRHCKAALEIDPSSVKGLFRRARAYLKMHQYEEAKADCEEALQLESSNTAVLNQLRIVEDCIEKEKQMYRKMFS